MSCRLVSKIQKMRACVLSLWNTVKVKTKQDKEEHVIEFMCITNRCNMLCFSVFIWLWNMSFIPWRCSRHTPSSPWQVLAVFWLTSNWRRSQGKISHCAQGQTVVFTVCCYLATQSPQIPLLSHSSEKALIIPSNNVFTTKTSQVHGVIHHGHCETNWVPGHKHVKVPPHLLSCKTSRLKL